MGVLIVEHEYDKPADFRLARLCEWAGFKLSDFQRTKLSANTHFLRGADNQPPPVVFALGPHAYRQLGLPGTLHTGRGYIWPLDSGYAIPSNSPAFIQKGQSKWSAPFINDLQKAVQLSQNGIPPQFTSYLLDPSPLGALEWARRYVNALDHDPSIYLAFDIETPGKPEDEDEADTDSDAPDRTWNIERIGFSYKPLDALSIPWAPEYSAAIRLLLGQRGSKVVWNAGFDVPRIRRAGVEIEGIIHDGMVAWHILHTDLPKRLGFVATFTCPWQPAWKHLSGSRPAYYNATDADVELRSMLVIEEELKRANLWQVYERDVVELDPILVHMHQKGMPVDAEIRSDRARKLERELVRVREEMEQAVPLQARKIAHIYKKEPKDVAGLYARPGVGLVRRCSTCGARNPRADHFKRFVKKVNPCCDGKAEEREEPITEYYRLGEFTPSRTQLIEYHRIMNRPLPMIWDKKAGKRKVSFGERQLRDLTSRYRDDKLYPLILTYRELDKIAGTYIGRPSE